MTHRSKEQTSAGKKQWTASLLVVLGLGLGGLALWPAATHPAAARQHPRGVRREPLGEYARCEEDCPPPGISAQPSEVWCVTRPQCLRQEGCGCRLFKRKSDTLNFEYAAETERHVPREPGYAYVCWCTKKKGQ